MACRGDRSAVGASVKILVDMNLSPDWCPVLAKHGWTATHWFEVGDPRAPDEEIMAYARAGGYVVLTHDLDFGAILAATKAQGPSVIQVRTQQVLPGYLEPIPVPVLKDLESTLEAGALVVVAEGQSRVRILPLST